MSDDVCQALRRMANMPAIPDFGVGSGDMKFVVKVCSAKNALQAEHFTDRLKEAIASNQSRALTSVELIEAG